MSEIDRRVQQLETAIANQETRLENIHTQMNILAIAEAKVLRDIEAKQDRRDRIIAIRDSLGDVEERKVVLRAKIQEMLSAPFEWYPGVPDSELPTNKPELLEAQKELRELEGLVDATKEANRIYYGRG